jgi:hypothetical protein
MSDAEYNIKSINKFSHSEPFAFANRKISLQDLLSYFQPSFFAGKIEYFEYHFELIGQYCILIYEAGYWLKATDGFK